MSGGFFVRENTYSGTKGTYPKSCKGYKEGKSSVSGIRVGGDWNIQGGFFATNSKVQLVGGSSGLNLRSSQKFFDDLDIIGNYMLIDKLDVDGRLIIANTSVLDSSAMSYKVTGRRILVE